jgi:acetylornithine deacetylase/succinyl-diaminopimelate desuccinylase-like protein
MFTSAAATHDQIAAARVALDQRAARVIETQIAATAIAAPTGGEHARATWLADRFRELRLHGVQIDAAGNVIATRPGVRARTNDAPLVICAHLDTVFPADTVVKPRRDGTRVFAPGICDNGRGLAAMLALAEIIDGHALTTQRAVQFVGTTGEEGEGDLRGAKHFFANNPAHAAIALDGAGDDRIVHRAVGSRRFRVTFDGPGGHSWSNFGVANPLHASAAAMSKLTELRLPAEPRTTLTIARAGGGLSVNSIPQSAWFDVDVRSVSDEPVKQLEAALRGIVAAAAIEANATAVSQVSGLTSHVRVIGHRPAGQLPATEPLVTLAADATRLVGRTPELAHASTDANVPLSLGIPAIAIGGGGTGGDTHTLNEWYDDADGARGLARALTIVVAAAV